MGDIVWMIQPAETEAGSLKLRMERFAYEICSSKNVEIRLQLNVLDQVKFRMEQKKNIYLLFKEALNNAVKYSGSNNIEVKASLQNEQLDLSIIDYGKGFDGLTVKRGNGLNTMQLRATALRSKFVLESKINTGTTVLLSVPV
jgi:signal transduction histidine kinase